MRSFNWSSFSSCIWILASSAFRANSDYSYKWKNLWVSSFNFRWASSRIAYKFWISFLSWVFFVWTLEKGPLYWSSVWFIRVASYFCKDSFSSSKWVYSYCKSLNSLIKLEFFYCKIFTSLLKFAFSDCKSLNYLVKLEFV